MSLIIRTMAEEGLKNLCRTSPMCVHLCLPESRWYHRPARAKRTQKNSKPLGSIQHVGGFWCCLDTGPDRLRPWSPHGKIDVLGRALQGNTYLGA